MRCTVPDDFERMWADLAPIGRSAASGGYFRQPFLTAERELSTWFAEQAAARDLRLETDAFGNQVAWWDPSAAVVPDDRGVDRPVGAPSRQGPPRRGALLTGSHLDSVLDGGAYDGPLGVVSALAAIDLVRGRGVLPTRPVGVSVFVEEEGSRFGLACLGSRLAAGTISWEQARELADRDGVRLGDVVDGGGRRRCSRGWRRSSSCTSSRAATSSTGARRSGWPARSGRTVATASTSPARPTTPAPRGWRTAPTRC